MPTAPRSDSTALCGTLYLAFDLGQTHWNLAFTIGLGQPPREVRIVGGDTERLEQEIAAAKRRFDLPGDARVMSCYEAGRDGFWLHRWLQAHQVESMVIDSSSIEVNRRQRRSKTDKIDVRKLLKLLVRLHLGEPKVFSVVRVPSIEEEDERHLHRELKTLTCDETAFVNRIKGVLAGLGVRLEPDKFFPQRLKAVRQWDGESLPEGVRRRLLSDFAVLQAIRRELRELRRVQRAQIRDDNTRSGIKETRQLMGLKAVGLRTASVYSNEFFAWRRLKNRRQVGCLAGLCSTPHRSGSLQHEQGISRAGNRWIRSVAVELAWSWVHWQPDSALSQWYLRRFHQGGSRMRRIGIVALARKLLVELWKYLETGIPPQGAILVDWRTKLTRRKCVVRIA